MYDSEMMRAMDAACRGHADVVIASSRDLLEHCRADHARVTLVNHGVDHAHFSTALALRDQERPADLPEGALIGFFGLLSEWVDQALLVRVARTYPEVSIVLIGRADVAVDALKAEPNIHLLGPRPFCDLPRYVAHFDVGVIPFVVNTLTLAVNPIKLREMLAAGCPVVSTALPEVAAYAGTGVVTAGDAESFVAAIAVQLERAGDMAARAALSDAMKSETWAAKTGEILGVIEGVGGMGGRGKIGRGD